MGLHALRKKIGDTRFFLLLKQYQTNHKYQNAFTTDFTTFAEEIAGPGPSSPPATAPKASPPKRPTPIPTTSSQHRREP